MKPAAMSLVVVFAAAAAATVLAEKPAAPTPYHGKPHVIPGKIEAEHFDKGPAGVAYRDVDEKNLGADYREPTQVDIEKRDDASGGHGIGWTRKGEWLIYTVAIQEAGEYTLEAPVASNKQGGRFHLEIEGKDVSGPVEIPDTGGWQTLKVIRHPGVKLPQGTFPMKVVMDQQGPSGSIGDIDYLRFIPAGNDQPAANTSPSKDSDG